MMLFILLACRGRVFLTGFELINGIVGRAKPLFLSLGVVLIPDPKDLFLLLFVGGQSTARVNIDRHFAQFSA
ncbi:unnamed protein product [Knipowitschia caucasica]